MVRECSPVLIIVLRKVINGQTCRKASPCDKAGNGCIPNAFTEFSIPYASCGGKPQG